MPTANRRRRRSFTYEVGASLVANLGQVVLCADEDFALVDAAKLRVAAQVLLVEPLQQRVQQAAANRKMVGWREAGRAAGPGRAGDRTSAGATPSA